MVPFNCESKYLILIQKMENVQMICGINEWFQMAGSTVAGLYHLMELLESRRVESYYMLAALPSYQRRSQAHHFFLAKLQVQQLLARITK